MAARRGGRAAAPLPRSSQAVGRPYRGRHSVSPRPGRRAAQGHFRIRRLARLHGELAEGLASATNRPPNFWAGCPPPYWQGRYAENSQSDSEACWDAELARPLRRLPVAMRWPGEGLMKRRDFLKSASAFAAGGAVSAPAIWSPAKAQSRQETLLIVSESGPNNIDIHGVGTNVPGYEVSWNCYDRLVSHEMKTDPNGQPYYNKDKFKMELADDMKVGNMSVTFRLKKNATFQDGTSVTANDVKWSLDRAVTVGGFPTFQMGAGSLSKPEQFVVVDDNTVRVDFAKKDRLTIPDLAVIVPCVVNSGLVKKHATEKDPWGMEYTKQNTAGSGAYRVVNWTAGTEVVMERNDKWLGGPLPKIKRIVWRMVPSAGNRRALLERGDADISYDLPNKDFVELKANPKLSIISTPYSNGIQYIGMNVTPPPFDNLKVRQAVAYAIPYQKIMDAVLFGLSKPMFGASADKATDVAWPQPTKFNTDIDKAKKLMVEAGYPDGFETTLSFDLGFAGINEPLCVLTQ